MKTPEAEACILDGRTIHAKQFKVKTVMKNVIN
jgi:hypothetical protein